MLAIAANTPVVPYGKKGIDKMLFTPENAQKVILHQKTQTRRLCQVGDEVVYDAAGAIVTVLHNGRKKWQVGHLYSIQPGRTKSGIGFFMLKSIRQEPVNKISRADAIAEGVEQDSDGNWLPGGFVSKLGPILAYRKLWNSIYKKQPFNTAPLVWALEIETI